MQQVAQQSWELENAVTLIDPQRDTLYNYDEETHKTLSAQRPWAKDPHYFKTIRISALALLKMVMHARSGGSLEVMGLMQGYILPETFVVTDAYRLPVEGTETRVNAQEEANEYMVSYLQSCRDAGRMENAVGWYHSHPGYGCWLSGIDVTTQDMQQLGGPFVAVVIDPERTISAGKVDIGAFRTFPKDYVPPKEDQEDGGAEGTSAGGDGYQTVPLSKAEDFGAHASHYYSLEVSIFKSSLDSAILDLLWNKYWVATLSQSPLFATRDYGSKQMMDLSQKVRRATRGVESNASRGNAMQMRDHQLDRVARDGQRIVSEEVKGLLAAEVKRKLFQGIGQESVTDLGTKPI
ncbi:Mov34/MPN/PAD-1 family protein [Aspergillus saccharolyticus JOP 1030-1]|uniref:COP9 signalosome complex subunit 5 n=1 Tax=Aspergillus saccharolyticus JOP 1030-1 TaxID=1450539 RepID=A0A318Z2X8_9EURO|nr:COP9 signalosome complex subunit 5 [Aspergillus saccharolyticus JOP 1030-1]PYH41625.1 COP9 signalosome complex subunit 5 [Aspergillus saccharolyticus JOP 1030-1]